MHCFKIITLILGLFVHVCVLSADVLRLVTTTSTENSGLTDHLIPNFTKQAGIEVHVIAVGTGKALAIARNGDADVILVHSKPDELEFVDQGYGVVRHEVMYNDFILVGPVELGGVSSAVEALKQVAQTESLFLSRGDDSGTHKKELGLWQMADINPQGPWYRESGQGMGKTLQIASELGAYVLTDRGTWLAQNSNQSLDLSIVFEGDEHLFNPYGVIAVSPEKYAHVNNNGANEFIDWLTSANGQALIAEFTIEGQQLFFPSAD